MDLLVGTTNGLFRLRGLSTGPEAFEGLSVTCVSRSGGRVWLVTEGRTVWRSAGDTWEIVCTLPDGLEARCLLARRDELLVGTAGAHVLRVDISTGECTRLDAFESIEGRQGWGNPGGGPPDTRSMSEDPTGRLYVNVHVGGIVVSDDHGASWSPTAIDVDTDVHQVVALPDEILAATGRRGMCRSHDGGATWAAVTEGLPLAHQEFGMRDDHYCRAVTVVGDTVLITASTGTFSNRAGIFRGARSATTHFEKCTIGLPEWFADNIDTGCLVASGSVVSFGTSAGEIYRSSDEGMTWQQVAAGLPPVRCLVPMGGDSLA